MWVQIPLLLYKQNGEIWIDAKDSNLFLMNNKKAQVSRGLKRKCINPVDNNVNTGRWNPQGEVV